MSKNPDNESLKQRRILQAEKARAKRMELLASDGYKEQLKERKEKKIMEALNNKYNSKSVNVLLEEVIKKRNEADIGIIEMLNKINSTNVKPPVNRVAENATDSDFSNVNILKSKKSNVKPPKTTKKLNSPVEIEDDTLTDYSTTGDIEEMPKPRNRVPPRARPKPRPTPTSSFV